MGVQYRGEASTPTIKNLMAYSLKTVAAVQSSKKTLGSQLGRWAVHRDFPVVQIARITGATRQSVYNWFNGGEVFVAYRPAVKALIDILQSEPNADTAWRKACTAFNLQA